MKPNIQAESCNAQKPNVLILIQAKLLNCVGMMYSGDQHAMTIAKSYHGDLVSYCDTEWNNSKLLTDGELQNDGLTAGDKWRIWYEGEICRRTGYCIWVRLQLSFTYSSSDLAWI